MSGQHEQFLTIVYALVVEAEELLGEGKRCFALGLDLPLLAYFVEYVPQHRETSRIDKAVLRKVALDHGDISLFRGGLQRA